ncbi:glycosyltransferase [Flavobacterium hibernum]|uniref:Glycosyl transferase family 2 n=1 Tax=Flavobacterium hibernum TaxID=37752 RepID=A0A0D0EWQ8_9FLAO|nr:glycosyltransferase [Flavobacterium hibernum]KIO53408.1 glycosyl transferase family 2 [Flavobacterium hibernum]OXA88011.1 glycosyl transferase family 2 [Flavobacterium hibernum]STO10607.1 Poly-beta-1,6-N-acetyl-D-glucosamine synthase [Flavobacterium hibernum]
MKSETLTSEQFYTSNPDLNTEQALKSSIFRISNDNVASKKVSERTKSKFGLFVLVSTFILLFVGAYSVYHLQADFDQFQIDRINSSWGLPFLIVAGILFFFQTGVFLYNLYLYYNYKPIESVSDEMLPTVTVIVPAYNEGKLVWDTLMSLAESDFPAHKLEILAVDDGSKDDTWYWMQQAKIKLGDRLTIFQQPENAGKRHALHRGFELGMGEIFVTVDSDSIVKKDTLRNLVSPFVVDEKCGAVAGNVHVLNSKKAILPKMLNVSFVMSFEFMRSAESKLGSVLCTPGAAAAYRKTSVFACLDEWINQTFMGQPSDIGEDRAMTNMILKQGQHVLFQRNAYVLTNVPEEYTGLYKMFIRWSRSNVRENIAMAKYVFTDFRKESKFGSRLLWLNQATKIVMAYPFMLFMFFFIAMHPLLFLSSTLLGILIVSSFPVLFYAKRYNLEDSLWAYSYSVFYTFSLFWITPYAIVTANKRGWLTRGLV